MADFDPGMCDEHLQNVDEFESAYADEFELLQELEEKSEVVQNKKSVESSAATSSKKRPLENHEKVSEGSCSLDTADISSDLPFELPVSSDHMQSNAPEKKRRLDFTADPLPEKISGLRRQIYHVPPAGLCSEYVSLSRDVSRPGAAANSKLYVPVMDELEYEAGVDDMKASAHDVNLLPISVGQLKLQLIREGRNRQILGLDAPPSDGGEETVSSDDENDKENRGERGSREQAAESLWVEKYAPRHYVDLLSDDGINRTLLHWLKLWDKVVFNVDRQTLKVAAEKREKKKLKEQQQAGGYVARKFLPEVKDEFDKFGRPTQRITLLSGPPGLGKTTLAHTIAKHAGYNVIEMNASDDRSAQVFKNKIEDATQMKSVLGDDPRPNCLVIDEIDGAPKAAITVLLTILSGGTAASASGEDKKRRQNKGKEQVLKRPIICICNDLYAPALKNLRQTALILQFPATESNRLVTRLFDICYKERIRCDSVALTTLCEKTDNDIRACINTLQFVRNNRHRSLTVDAVRSMQVGQKDSHKPLFSIWQEMFQLPKEDTKSKRKQGQKEGEGLVSAGEEVVGKLSGDPTDMRVRCHNMLQLVQSSGEYDKLLQGVFENYLGVKFKDQARMPIVNKGLQWMCFMDTLNTHTRETQNYTFLKYIPYGFAVMHLLFASKHFTKLSYPHSFYDVFTKALRSTQIVHSLFTDLSPRLKEYVSESSLILEVLPYLVDIIQPSLRPVSSQLYTAREKQDLANVVSIMIAYNVTYRQERRADGDYAYVLEPGVEDVIRFSAGSGSGSGGPQRQLTYNTKQLVAREIHIEKLRRNERFLSGKLNEGGKKSTPSDATKVAASDADDDTAVATSSSEQQPAEDKNVVKRRMEKSVGEFLVITPRGRGGGGGEALMMGKPTVSPDGEGAAAAAQGSADTSLRVSNMWYQYNEGINNAVRTPMYIKDFL